MRDVFIYSLACSDSPNNIRYIGKANHVQSRFVQHLSHCSLKYATRKNRWIKKCLRNGHSIIIEVVDIVNKDEWQFWERHWISQFKQWGFDLTNGTWGGDGSRVEIDYDKLFEELNIHFIDGVFCSSRQCHGCGSEVRYSSINPSNIVHSVQRALSNNRKCDKCSKKVRRKRRDHLIKAGHLNPNFGKVFSEQEKRSLREKNIVQEVSMFDLNGGFVRNFLSVREAADVTNLDRKSITWCCKKRPCANQVGGYVFRYKGDDPTIRPDGRKLQTVTKKALDGTVLTSFPSIGSAMKALGITQYMVTKLASTKKPVNDFYLEFT